MESLKFAMGSALSKVFGGTAETDENSVHDTVQRVISRLEISTLLEDRRNACKTLRALSSNYRSEVGSLGMDVLIQTLKNDKEDREIVGDILTTLNCIIAGDSNDESDEQTSDDPLDIPFTQMFIKKKENIELIFDIIRDKDYLDCRFRPQALKLFNAISRNRPKDIQDFILSTPMGVSTLVDLLSDFRDFIRLDAISLLTRLAKNNASIQKIAAYENAFDKLILLIEAEEFAAGGVIVKDCLVLLQNLLKNNDCTQNLFKEGNHIQKLGPLLSIIFNNDWPDEKVVQIKTNVHLTLQIIRMLVSPTNPQQVTTLCQNAIKSSGILLKLCDIIFYEGSPADIVTEVFNTIAEIIRGNHTNQAFFRKISDENSSAPILLRLLESMINSKNPLDLRCAALYCFQSFLYQNDVGQAHIIDGLLGSQVLDATMCELLCGSLLSSKLLSNWFASTALSHAIIGNQTQKQQLLSVHLAIKDQDSPISLLRLCCSRVQDGVKYQSRVGLLMLLSHWLSECPSAVSEFLQIVTNIPFLISEVSSRGGDESELVIQGLYAFLIGLCIQYNDGSVQSYSRENLLELIIRRVGVEIFSKKLSAIAQSEWYSVAASKPQIKINDENQLMFDYEFCKLFRSLESSIIKIVQNEPSIMSNGPECSMSAEQHTLLLQYKELIRRQDEDISSLKAQLEIAQKERNKAAEKIDELSSKYQQVLDQNALLRVQSSVYSPSHPSSLILGSTINNNDETSSQVSSSDMPARFVGSNIETMSMPDGSETKIPIMNEHEEERASMLEKMQSLEMQLSRAQIEANVALSERDNAQIRLSESEVVISQLESRVSEQNSVIQALTARNDELENAYSNISHQLYAAQQKIQHLEAYYGQALHSMNNQTTLNQEGLNSQVKQSGYQNESTPRYSNSDSTFSSDPGTHSSSQKENSSIPPSGMNHNSAGFLEL